MNLPLAQSEVADVGFLNSLFMDFSPDQRFVVCLVLIGCITAVVITVASILSGIWFHLRKGERETELVRELLAEGRSADEIERIVRPADGWSRAWAGCFKRK